MKGNKFLAGIGAAFCLVACNFLGGNYSSFNDVATFEYAYTLAEQVAMPECKDSLFILEKEFPGSNYFLLQNATIANGMTVRPGFIISVKKNNSPDEMVPYASFSRTGGYQSFGYAIYTDVRGASSTPSVQFPFSNEGTASFVGFYVNNTNQVVNLVERLFEDGDKMTLTVTTRPGGKETEVVLAEKKDGKLEVIKEWKEVRSQDSEAFSELNFSVTCNRTDIPLNVCIDNLTNHVTFGEKK